MINFREVVQGMQAMVYDQSGVNLSDKDVIYYLMKSDTDLEREVKTLKEMGFMK